MKVEVSNGELLDKLSILELKLKNINVIQILKFINNRFNVVNQKQINVNQVFHYHLYVFIMFEH